MWFRDEYEVMADVGLLEKPVPSCDLAVRYDKADTKLVQILMDWRKKGYSVMGVSARNTIEPGDYKMIVSYKNGEFLLDGKSFSPSAVEEKLGGLSYASYRTGQGAHC